MNPKTFDLYPTLKNINEDELDFSLFNAIAIPVLAKDEIKIIETKFIKKLIDSSNLIKSWAILPIVIKFTNFRSN